MLLSELLELQEKCHGQHRLFESVGDGYLYLHNPFFRRIREAAIARGFRYSLDDAHAYFGFPLIHLDSILESRIIPYRPSFIALRHLGSHDAFLQKPFTPRVLAQKVREILDQSR